MKQCNSCCHCSVAPCHSCSVCSVNQNVDNLKKIEFVSMDCLVSQRRGVQRDDRLLDMKDLVYSPMVSLHVGDFSSETHPSSRTSLQKGSKTICYFLSPTTSPVVGGLFETLMNHIHNKSIDSNKSQYQRVVSNLRVGEEIIFIL